METTTQENVSNQNSGIARVEECKSEVVPIMDALYVISGKWRVPITLALMEGNKRFGEIQKAVWKITSKVLAHELKEMELNGFIERKVNETLPGRIEYELTEYSWSIKPIIILLRDFGRQHRDKIRKERGQKA
ncbi:helix-turn-helix transcriptional regulator [Flavobacterium sp. LS1R49]|uniref:Helix-turn-helix transcriptional regulator n=1 Tax=Flavobacterium shii TaxID=2987687 RepID=A0A9X2ZB10_9FLAO|nr:helix-turn-helix domain-containing protein [Flavobacterium shii]MCV9927886.1 helix-turn-helix transcriptional regulator [Flavobacterium shii]